MGRFAVVMLFVVGCDDIRCDAMWLCWLRDIVNWEMMCCEHGNHMTAKPLRSPFQCAVQPWDANTLLGRAHVTVLRIRTTQYYDSMLQCNYNIHITTTENT